MIPVKDLEKRRIRDKIYRQRPEVKARKKAYEQRPEVKARHKAWRTSHKEEIAIHARAYYISHKKEYAIRCRTRKLRVQYGLTPEAFKIIFINQNRICAICGTTDWGIQGPTVDHDHKTGKIRGILCHICNKALGSFKDSPVLLRIAINYLEKSIKSN